MTKLKKRKINQCRTLCKLETKQLQTHERDAMMKRLHIGPWNKFQLEMGSPMSGR